MSGVPFRSAAFVLYFPNIIQNTYSVSNRSTLRMKEGVPKPEDLPETDADVEPVDPEELKRRIDEGEEVFILDTRSREESEKWRIEGDSVETVNIPYFEFVSGDSDIDESLVSGLPGDKEIVAVCAKGISSEYVAGVLEGNGYDAVHLEDGMNGWARLYERHEIEVGDTEAKVYQYQRPSSGCLAYLVVDAGEAVVIDPLRAFTGAYAEDVDSMDAELKYAVDTHVHADHISGVRDLARETAAEAVLPEAAAARGAEYDTDYLAVEDGDSLTVGDTEVEVVHTPGHTTGMTSYRVGNVLFTGDSLFTESVARPDLEEGDEGAEEAAGELHDTLHRRILTLPDSTVVAPAHYSGSATPNDDGSYTARLGELKESMDALSLRRDGFVEYVLSDMPPRPGNYEEIIATNLGQKDVSDDEAFTLELGPNNCATSQEALTGD